MKNIIPYNETLDLGKGINSLTGLAKGKIFTSFDFTETTAAQGQAVDFKMDQIESTEQLYSSLGISIEAEGRYGLFSASGKFQLAQESNFNSHSIFLLLKVRVKNAVKRIQNYKIDPNIIEILKEGKTDRFQRGFGDSFIEGIITGGEFFALYELICTDENSKQEMSAELNVSYGAFGAGFDLSAKFNQTVQSASSKKNLKIITYQTGGKGLQLVTNPDEIVARAKAFPDLVKDNLGVPYEVIYSSYETLASLPEGPNYVDLENKKFVLDSYSKDIVELRTTYNDLKYILFNPEEFEKDNEDLDENDIIAIHNTAKAVSDNINEYTKHASVCADSPSQCETFTPSSVIDLTNLPKRKTNLDVVVLYDGIDYTGNATYLTKGEYPKAHEIGGLQNDSISSVKIPKNFKVVLWENVNYSGGKVSLLDSVPDLTINNFSDKTSSIYITDFNGADKPTTPLPTPPSNSKGGNLGKLVLARNLNLAQFKHVRYIGKVK
jgi:hypothetical protein